jgi:hypothetical protein
MKISNEILKFAGGEDKLAPYLMFADYWNHYRAEHEKGENAKNIDYQKFDKNGNVISFSQKEDEMNKVLRDEIIRQAFNGINPTENSVLPLEAWATHPNLSWATSSVVSAMIEMVLPDTIIDSIGSYTDVKSGDWGDSFSFDITPRDLFVVSKQGRDRRTTELRKQYKGQVTVVPEPRQLSAGVALYRVLSGKESLAEFVAKVVRSLESQMTVDVYNTFATAMAALPTSPANTALQVTGYTQQSLVALAQRIGAWNGGNQPIVMGTRLALANIVPANANYRYDIESDYVKIGYIRTISGYDIMMLPQVAAWNTPFTTAIDDSKLWIVSPSASKLVKLCLEGSTLSNVSTTFQNANLTQSFSITKSYGTAIATSAIAGVIALQ